MELDKNSWDGSNTGTLLPETKGSKGNKIDMNSDDIFSDPSLYDEKKLSKLPAAKNVSMTRKNAEPDPDIPPEEHFTETKPYDINTLAIKEKTNEYIQSYDQETIIDEDTVCGIGCFKPKWIQKYARPRVFLFLFSITGIIQGIYYSYFISVLSTLEKRYAFNSKVSGAVMLVEELTPLFLGIFVGYIGGKIHRPRLIALGMMMSAACYLLSAFPFMIYGTAKHLSIESVKNETTNEVCELKTDDCDSDERPTAFVVGILVFAFLLKGFSTISFQVIGISYMDDSTKKKNTPLYLAITVALRLLGPLVGFLMSSVCLKYYENPFEDPGFGPDDPRWIGAWWIGFIFQGVLLAVFTIPIALFPRRLPNHKKPERKASAAKKESMKEMFYGLVDALKRLVKNPPLVLLAVNSVLQIFGHFGHAIMLPRYMENQFRLTAADASLYSGASSVTSVMISTMVGGFLIWKFRPSIKILLLGMVASEIFTCVGYIILMFLQCQPSEMLNFGQNAQGLILNDECNQHCDCSTTTFTPFCGQDGKTMYFSPCYAGCTQELTSFMSEKEKKIFGNCSCVTEDVDAMAGKITEGFCPDENCWTVARAYIGLLLFKTGISNTLIVAHTMVLLRSIHPSDKSVALGTFEAFCCLFGFIPFPVTYGAIVDSACLVWEKTCGHTGNCWFYDLSKYRFLLHGASLFFCFLSVCCSIGMYCFRARIRSLYEEEDDDEPESIKLDNVPEPLAKL